MKIKKTLSLSSLDKKLWRIFSKFIRLRDSYEYWDGQRIFACISCGEIKLFDQMHAGHYYSKKAIHKALRFDEQNVNGQCVSCNTFDEGNRQGYAFGLVKKYGEGILEKLEMKKHNKCNYDRFAYESLIKEYEEKLNNL